MSPDKVFDKVFQAYSYVVSKWGSGVFCPLGLWIEDVDTKKRVIR